MEAKLYKAGAVCILILISTLMQLDLSLPSAVHSGLRTPVTHSLPQEEDYQCDFYLAESSIPHGGLGVFTAITIEEGGATQPQPDLCLYVANARPDKGTEIPTHTWQDWRFGAQWLSHGKNRAQCMGLVTLFNSMPVKYYASARPKADPDLIYTNGGLYRDKDPGAGAISHFYGSSSMALRDLTPGSELLIWDDR